MPNAAIYARYSTDDQRATSIDDQVRRCKEIAERHALTIDAALIFSDSAITGTSKGNHKRTGYARLQDAIAAGVCDTVISDEVSRLTRSPAEGGRLIELAEATGVRFITADGIDTSQDNWKMHWFFKLTAATHEVDAASHRTKRGMLGQLQRGYQIAQAPFGYRAMKDVTESGKVEGTRWTIHEGEAEVIRLMYRLRIGGYSTMMIAKHLNDAGIPPPGQHRCDGAAYWRGATVLRLLANTIYRGVFVWNGSSFTKLRAKKRRKVAAEEHFARPALRIVSDEDWFKANPRFASLYTGSHAPRGGGKRLFSGLVRCGDCGALCSPGPGHGRGSLYCPQCYDAVRAGGKASWMGYSSIAAALQAVNWVLKSVFAQGPALSSFHQRMGERLRSGPTERVAALRGEIAHLDAVIARIKVVMLSVNDGAAQFAEEFNQAVGKRAERMSQLVRAEAQCKRVDEAVVEAQRKVDVLPLLEQLFDPSAVEPFKLRATLSRFLSCFVLVARPKRGVSVFRVGLMPGVLAAELTGTATLDETAVVYELRVSAVPGRRPVEWSVEVLSVNGEPVQA